ncbi:MAG: hypothetical protein ACLTBV_17080 [Enterocloster bolteae]
MTAREKHCLSHGTQKGAEKKSRRRRVEALLRKQFSFLDLKRRMKEMSGPEAESSLARALAAEPGVLLLDEPFSGLDEGLRTEMAQLVRKLHEAWKITTILVTHDKAEALRLSDRIALMEDGKILQYGTRSRCSAIRKQKRWQSTLER